MTGNWAQYSWVPAIVLVSVTVIFLMDLGAERYVEMKYGAQEESNVENLITGRSNHGHVHPDAANFPPALLQVDDIEAMGRQENGNSSASSRDEYNKEMAASDPVHIEKLRIAEERAFKQQFAAFLILEFGVIFHSVCSPRLTEAQPQTYALV